MSYDEWLASLNTLRSKNDEEIKNKLLNEPLNENLKNLLEPKIIDLLKYKFHIAIDKIKYSLEETMYDVNMLDLHLNGLKKDLKFLVELIDIKELSDDKRQIIKEVIIEESDKVYDILLKEARTTDPVGILEQVIKNNRIKWS